VLGLIALLATVVSSMNFSSMLENDGSKPAYEIFREATHEGRIQSINSAKILFLSFDQETQTFRLMESDKAAAPMENERGLLEVNRYGYIEDEPEPELEEGSSDEVERRREFKVYEDELVVEFYGLKAGEARGFSASNASYTNEPLPHLVFHPSGVSSPSVAILRYSNGDELTLTMDSFSNGPQLSGSEEVGF